MRYNFEYINGPKATIRFSLKHKRAGKDCVYFYTGKKKGIKIFGTQYAAQECFNLQKKCRKHAPFVYGKIFQCNYWNTYLEEYFPSYAFIVEHIPIKLKAKEVVLTKEFVLFLKKMLVEVDTFPDNFRKRNSGEIVYIDYGGGD